MALQTTATFDESTDEFIIHSPSVEPLPIQLHITYPLSETSPRQSGGSAEPRTQLLIVLFLPSSMSKASVMVSKRTPTFVAMWS